MGAMRVLQRCRMHTAATVALLLLAAAASCTPTTATPPNTFVHNPTAHFSSDERTFIEHLWQQALHAPVDLARAGYKHELEGRNWPRLVHKLLTGGGTVRVAAFGGSVTVGYRLSNTSYPERFVAWLSQAFPDTQFEFIPLARRATAATFAALCMVQQLPADTDLVLVEYSVNGYGGQCQCFTAPQTAGYEALLRKTAAAAPHAALLGFAAFMWLDKEGRPGTYYDTGEDQHGVVARRYGMPMVSARDALFDAMFDAQTGARHGINRSQVLVDAVHVGDHGADVYAGLLAWAVRHQATRVLLQHKSLAGAARHTQPLPPPLNPEAAQESWPTFCAEGIGLKHYIVNNTGWTWVDEGSSACEGCHRYGFMTRNQGASLEVRVNSDVLTQADTAAGAKVMAALTFLKSYSDVGSVRVECVAGCTCTAKTFDARNSRPTSELHTERMEVGPAAECVLRFTILPDTSTGGHKFRLASVAVHKADKVLSYAYGPVYD